VIEPGLVATEMSEYLTEQAAQDPTLSWMRSITPLASEDIAAAIVYAVTQPAQVDVNELLIQPVTE
jgi:NADP-dependent 3-hydroxy acid dehydrogenase YdfG